MGLLTQTGQTYYGDASNYGSYQFTSLNDIVNNFIIAYVGESKIISKINKTDVLFHAKRGIQEFNFDTLPSTKSIEIDLPSTLAFILPMSSPFVGSGTCGCASVLSVLTLDFCLRES